MNQRDFLYETIKNRVSIRKFKKQDIPEDIVSRVLEAGLHAPSGKNRQNWKFFVVQGDKRDEYLNYSKKTWQGIKDILKSRLKPSLYDFTERFFYTLGDAPVVIFCYSQNSLDERHITSIGSVFMAVQNMVLAATAEGLGTCPMGAPLEIKDEIDSFLGVDGTKQADGTQLELLCALVIGWPDHQPPKAPRQFEGRIIRVGK